MKAKKKFGQHFLIDEKYIEDIATAITDLKDRCNAIIEVGPGKGAITEKIYTAFESFYAIEIDQEAISHLNKNFASLSGNIIEADFLSHDLKTIFPDQQFILAGNYPYNISSQIIFKMISYRHQIPFMIGMFQREVAERIVSNPNSKAYGIISVLTQFHYKGRLLFNLEPEAFDPPPKVFSSVILLERHEDYIDFKDEKLFKAVVKQGFNQRRKMLRNTLKSFFKDPENLTKDIFTKRPEHLSVQDFIYICELIKKDQHES